MSPSSDLVEGSDLEGLPGSEHVPALDLPTAAGAPSRSFAATLESEEDKILTCVHCGFCLPACPTYTRLGDENDSPRGRLHLMLAVVHGRLDADSLAFQKHIDQCVGCRACETVCPSGVQYGALLELARVEAAEAKKPRWSERAILKVFSKPRLTELSMIAARWMRGLGIAALAARVLPRWGWFRGPRLAAAMLVATSPWRGLRRAPNTPVGSSRAADEEADALALARGGDSAHGLEGHKTAAILRGCVQEGLLRRVNQATERVVRANGLEIVEAKHQGCCGALHAHAGDLEGARWLARRNIEAFDAASADLIVVNAAGCGAVMKEYGKMLEHDPLFAERAKRFAATVRDVSEVLADRGPKRGAVLGLTVTADAPCHLLHAQGVAKAPAAVLDAIPGLKVVPLRRADECCGGAGIYGLKHPDLGGRIGSDKVAAVAETGADVVVTGNVGCIMQIGAGLHMAGVPCRALHPVELLDESYRRAGLYK